MSLISIPSSETNAFSSEDTSEFKQDFIELVTSLKSGNRRAAATAFAAVKLGFQRATPTPKSSVDRPSKQTSSRRR